MSYTTIHTIEIDGHAVAEYWISSCDAPAKPERKKTAILAMLARALISEATSGDSGMTMLDTELAEEYLERIACGEDFTIRERGAII